jgi:hypothetical protein
VDKCCAYEHNPNPIMNPTIEKQFKAISPQCWEMYDQNKRLWNEIFKLGVQAERSRIKLRSGVRHWAYGGARA